MARRGRMMDQGRAALDLVRLLKGQGFESPEGLEPVAARFAAGCGFRRGSLWPKLLERWDVADSPVGDDAFDRAVVTAKATHGIMFTPAPGPAYHRVAVLAWLLQDVDPAGDFVFATPRIAGSFGVCRKTAANAVNALLRRGLLVCTSASYSYARGEARRFRFVADVAYSRADTGPLASAGGAAGAVAPRLRATSTLFEKSFK